MSVLINTNTAATTAVYDLGVSGKNLKRSLDRLSSGSRINTSFDDAGAALFQQILPRQDDLEKCEVQRDRCEW
jgi:hypothetical protein